LEHPQGASHCVQQQQLKKENRGRENGRLPTGSRKLQYTAADNSKLQYTASAYSSAGCCYRSMGESGTYQCSMGGRPLPKGIRLAKGHPP